MRARQARSKFERSPLLSGVEGRREPVMTSGQAFLARHFGKENAGAREICPV